MLYPDFFACLFWNHWRCCGRLIVPWPNGMALHAMLRGLGWLFLRSPFRCHYRYGLASHTLSTTWGLNS